MRRDSFQLLGLEFFAGGPEAAADLALSWRGRSTTVCAVNAHTLASSLWDEGLRDALASADLRLPDGKPLVWAARLMGAWRAKQARGADFCRACCDRGRRRKARHYFFGAEPGVAAAAAKGLQDRYPGLLVAGVESPPYRRLTRHEESDLQARLAKKRVNFLWVGLGAPKQELWAQAWKGRAAACSTGIGAAFDFFAGTRPEAPAWARALGLEWAQRLASEPGRLWRRYLVTNAAFCAGVLAQMLGLFKLQVLAQRSLRASLEAWDRWQGALDGALVALFSGAQGPPARSAAPRKILVLRPDEVGDNVLDLAFIQGLHRLHPKAEIWLGVKAALIPLLQGQPGVDRLLPVELPIRRLFRWPLAFRQGSRVGKTWAGLGFDVCYLPRFGADYHGAAWAAWAAGIPRREGFGGDSPERRRLNPGGEALLTRVWPASSRPLHELERLGEALGLVGLKGHARPRPLLRFGAAERKALAKRLRRDGWDGRRPLVMLGLDAGNMRRAWPAQRFAALTAGFPGVHWLLQASPQRGALVAQLGAGLPGIYSDLSGFSLRECAVAAGMAKAYVGADSGPKHMAQAAGVPAIEVSAHAQGADPFHSSAPERFGPWVPGSRVLRPARPLPPCDGPCSGHGPHCITQIQAPEVAAALQSILGTLKGRK